MKRIRLWVRAFFGFSRMETNAFLILMPIMLITLFSEPLYSLIVGPGSIPDIVRTDSLYAWIETRSRLQQADVGTIPFHSFDPNIVPATELVALGLDSNMAVRIIRFREKGGQFRKKVDLLKIYGMDSSWYWLAEPWIAIAQKKAERKRITQKPQVVIADINTSDTTDLMEVYGIGSVLAKRIVTFRDRLGGYIRMGQLREVYGLDSIVIERMGRRFQVLPGFEPRKIHLRDADMEALTRHPYISRKQASAILGYRSQHGIDSLGVLTQIKLLDKNWLEKARPYLTLEPFR